VTPASWTHHPWWILAVVVVLCVIAAMWTSVRRVNGI